MTVPSQSERKEHPQFPEAKDPPDNKGPALRDAGASAISARDGPVRRHMNRQHLHPARANPPGSNPQTKYRYAASEDSSSTYFEQFCRAMASGKPDDGADESNDKP